MEGLKVERLGGENATVESGKTKAKDFTQSAAETQSSQRRVERQRRRILHRGARRHRGHREEWKDKTGKKRRAREGGKEKTGTACLPIRGWNIGGDEKAKDFVRLM